MQDIKIIFTFANVKLPTIKNAEVAQLVERQPSKLNVASSNLVSRSKMYASLAQLVEHLTLNQEVTGSTPV